MFHNRVCSQWDPVWIFLPRLDTVCLYVHKIVFFIVILTYVWQSYRVLLTGSRECMICIKLFSRNNNSPAFSPRDFWFPNFQKRKVRKCARKTTNDNNNNNCKKTTEPKTKNDRSWIYVRIIIITIITTTIVIVPVAIIIVIILWRFVGICGWYRKNWRSNYRDME